MRRQKAYRQLPTHTAWWKAYEPGLVQGIEARVRMGEMAGPPVVWLPAAARDHRWGEATNQRNERLVAELIIAADAAWRRDANPVRDEAH